MNDKPVLAASRLGGPTTPAATSSDAVMSPTTTPFSGGAAVATGARLVHTAQYSSTALREGHGSLLIARRIVTPFATSWSRPTSRVSPCANVLVAISPVWPPVLSSACARSTK
jgi:hypothetical protein